MVVHAFGGGIGEEIQFTLVDIAALGSAAH